MAVKIMKRGLRQSIRKSSARVWLRFSSFVVIALIAQAAQSEIDYETQFASNVVVGSTKITIPNFNGAFNPSIIRYQGALLLSFRYIPNRNDNFTSYIGIVFLNEDLTVKGEARLLNLRAGSTTKSRAEDARLVTVGSRLYAVYSDNVDPKITKGGFRVYVVELWFENGALRVGEPEKLSEFDGDNPNMREKNWVAFDDNGQLKLAYSLEPHIIFLPHLGSGRCETIANTTRFAKWGFGELRGGTPAFLVGDEYLAFFHSSVKESTKHSNGKPMMHYFMGAYTFQKNTPHTLTSMSKVPIVGKGFYSGEQFKGYWKPVRAIFPGGYVFDDKHIYVAYGKDDADVWVAKLDRRALMESLVRFSN
jgi:predicted GH43/DUF377 family glycosyl hydrolase